MLQGVMHPIIQAPMAGITTPELVATVSNAGGLGSFAAGYLSPHEIKTAIQSIRELTQKPFSVNLFIPENPQATAKQIAKACDDINLACKELGIKIDPLSPPYIPSFAEQMDVIIEERVPVFSFTFGVLENKYIQKLKQQNAILIGTATHLAEAEYLADHDIDFIVAQGKEAGGHRGTFLPAENTLIKLSELIPAFVAKINKPIIAAGGLMRADDVSHILELGATYVQLGTAFLCCPESGLPSFLKKIILENKKDTTVLTNVFSGKLARGLQNQFIQNMQKALILDYPIQNALTLPMRKAAKEKQNSDYVSIWAGQGVAHCRNIRAEDFINHLVSELQEV